MVNNSNNLSIFKDFILNTNPCNKPFDTPAYIYFIYYIDDFVYRKTLLKLL